MTRSFRSFLVVAVALSMIDWRLPARADFVLTNGYSAYRLREDGTLAFSYDSFLPPEIVNTIENYAEGGATVNTDRRAVYVFSNSLGFADIIASDVDSGAYRPDLSMLLTFGIFLPPPDAYVFQARRPLFFEANPHGLGDLFVISGVFIGGGNAPDSQIKRFDTASRSFVEAIDPPTGEGFFDFAFGPDNRLYFSTSSAIFAYSEDPAQGFDAFDGPLAGPPLISNAHGFLAFGPDGNLYVSDSVTGNIDRYSTAGVFTDTFIPASALQNGGTIAFGPDGNLYVAECCFITPYDFLAGISKYDGTTGQFLGRTLDGYLGPRDRIWILPIPEPTTLLLAMVGATFAACLLRRR